VCLGCCGFWAYGALACKEKAELRCLVDGGRESMP
jgi:hypothetical protein